MRVFVEVSGPLDDPFDDFLDGAIVDEGFGVARIIVRVSSGHALGGEELDTVRGAVDQFGSDGRDIGGRRAFVTADLVVQKGAVIVTSESSVNHRSVAIRDFCTGDDELEVAPPSIQGPQSPVSPLASSTAVSQIFFQKRRALLNEGVCCRVIISIDHSPRLGGQTGREICTRNFPDKILGLVGVPVIEFHTIKKALDFIMGIPKALFLKTGAFLDLENREVFPVVVQDVFGLDSGVDCPHVAVHALDANGVEGLQEVTLSLAGHVVVDPFAIIKFSEGGDEQLSFAGEVGDRRGDIRVEPEGLDDFFRRAASGAGVTRGHQVLVGVVTKNGLVALAALLGLLQIQNLAIVEGHHVFGRVFVVQLRDLSRLGTKSVLQIGPVDGVIRGLARLANGAQARRVEGVVGAVFLLEVRHVDAGVIVRVDGRNLVDQFVTVEALGVGSIQLEAVGDVLRLARVDGLQSLRVHLGEDIVRVVASIAILAGIVLVTVLDQLVVCQIFAVVIQRVQIIFGGADRTLVQSNGRIRNTSQFLDNGIGVGVASTIGQIIPGAAFRAVIVIGVHDAPQNRRRGQFA